MVTHRLNQTIRIFIFLTILLLSPNTFLNYAAGQDLEKLRFEEAAREYGFKLNYREVIDMLNLNRITEYVSRLASFRGRFTGYRGADEAAKFIYKSFNSFTDHAELQNYTIVVPVDEGARIKIVTIDGSPNGTLIEAYPLFPNLAQQCIVPEDGIIGRLVYFEEGLRTEDINGSILLMEFNTGSYWLEAVKMGGRAVIFIQPDVSSSDESLSKMVYTELYFPRLIVSRETGLNLKKLATQHEVKIALTSRIVYKKVTALNVVGFIWGSLYRNETIVVSAYYDDWCVAPSLAGGYDSAVSVSLLLELARVFSINRPSRNMLFLATSGHWQAAYGIKNFVMNMLLSNNPSQLPFRLGTNWNETTFFLVSLDLSTRDDELAVVSTGGLFHMSTRVFDRNIGDPPSICGLDRLYGGDERIYQGFPDVREAISRSLGMTFKVRAHLTEVFAGGSFNTTGSLGEYFTAIPEKYFVEAEVWLAAGLPGITFYTCALRKGWFSPTPINDINMDNLHPQATFITCFIHFLGNAKRKAFIGSRNPDFATVDFAGPTRFYIGRFSNTPVGLARMRVQTYEYNASEILQYSSVPSPLAYAVDKEEEGTIFYYTFSIGYENGTFEMIGFLVRPLTGFTHPRPFLLRAFVLNSTTGEIIYAPDFGTFGGRRFIDTVMLRSVESPDYGYPNPLRYILFKTGSITLFDVFHPRVYRELKWADSFNMELFSKLKGGFVSRPYIYPAEPGIRVYYVGSRVETISYGTTYDFERQVYTIFIPLATRVEIHIILQSEQEYVETVAMLTNASESRPRGYGFYVSRPGENIIITETLYRIARDLYWRSKSIVEACLSLSVFDEAAIKNLRDLERVLNEIENSRKMGKIEEIYSLQILAYAYASNSLISSENLLIGARSTAVVFFLLLIPFTLFSEKLITEFHSGKKRLIMITALFIVFSVPLIYLHPGFVLIENLPVLILGFITEIVLLLVFLLFWRESGTVVKEYKVAFRGKHFFEKSRFETAVFMFAHGVAQMKRRKLIFFLTMFSLIIITAAMLILFSTSGLPSPLLDERSWPSYFPWPGNYLHISDLKERGIFSKAIVQLKPLMGSDSRFCFMTFAYPPLPNINQRRNFFLAETEDGKTYNIPLIVGLSPTFFSLPAYRESIVRGDIEGFQSAKSPYVVRCLISDSFEKDTGLSVGKRFRVFGIDFLVTAVFDDRVMEDIRDYPAPSIRQLPEDFNMRIETPTGTAEEKVFITWDKVIIIPAEDCEKLFYAKPFKVIVVGNTTVFEEAARFLAFNSFNTNVVIGLNGKLRWYRTVTLLITGGSPFIFIPLILGCLIIANMLLGFFTLRIKEMSILSTLGASPIHASAILLSELSTYVLMGTVLGYTTGVILIKIFNPPVYPNFSSGYLLTVLAIQLFFMFGSSVPFLLKASKAVTPSLERRWRVPTKPKGDVWVIPTPFTSSPQEVPAILSFMKEWFDVHMVREPTARFVTVEPSTIIKEENAIKLSSMVILPPWEAALNQNIEIIAFFEGERATFSIRCNLKSGLKDVWIRSNQVFIYAVREQLLLWRGLSTDDKKKYLEMSKTLLEG